MKKAEPCWGGRGFVPPVTWPGVGPWWGRFVFSLLNNERSSSGSMKQPQLVLVAFYKHRGWYWLCKLDMGCLDPRNTEAGTGCVNLRDLTCVVWQQDAASSWDRRNTRLGWYWLRKCDMLSQRESARHCHTPTLSWGKLIPSNVPHGTTRERESTTPPFETKGLKGCSIFDSL